MKGIWLIALLSLLVLVGCQAPSSTTDADATAAPDASQEMVWASGTLTPVRWAGLSPAVSGTVSVIHVQEGDLVQAGDVLIDLDNGVMKSQVDVAMAAVVEAQVALARLIAGATPAQTAAAQAGLESAQAGLAMAQSEVVQAQEAVRGAEAQVAIAQAQYDDLASRPTAAEKQAAQREIDMALAALAQAQAAYNVVRGDPNIGMLPQALALEQATAGLNAAKAAYALATQGATPQQLAVANAQIAAAKVQAEAVMARIPAAEAAVKSAQAGVAGARAALDALLAGATIEDRAVAEAHVASAKAALATAQAQLAQAQIRAPFAGEIGSLATRIGELATPGQVLLLLGETDQMHVETTDLRETDVTRLDLGMPVEVSFDALPGRTFDGTIARISPMSNTEKGSTNYKVEIELTELDPSLRWGMTAFVNIRMQ